MARSRVITNKERISLKSWFYPADLVKAVKEDISEFYKVRNLSEKLNTTPGNYEILKNFIIKVAGFEIKEVWLRDFFENQNYTIKYKKTHFNSLLSTFNYYYDEISDSWEKLPQSIDLEFYRVFGNIKTQLDISISLSDYIGKYKYFLVTKREPNYPKIYENELEIFKDRTVKIYNPFLNHEYYGIAFLRNNILQILSFDHNGLGIASVGNVLNFRVNGYKRLALVFPGIAFGFDAENSPMAAQSLLCSDFAMTKSDKLIRVYFDRLAMDGKYGCPNTSDVEQLRYKLASGK